MKKQFEDTDFDSSIQKLDSDMIWNKTQKQKLKNRILTSIEESQQHEDNSNFMLSARDNQRSLAMKLVYSFAALIVLFGLFIGSAFISPAMAEIVSKIPYLNKVFQSERVNQVIWEELEEKGYKISGLSGRGENMRVYIDGSEQYVQDVREDVKNIVEKILKSRDYDNYKVEVIKDNNTTYQPSPETLKLEEEAFKVDDALQQELKKHNYPDVTTQVGTLNDSGNLSIYIGIPNTEKKPEEIKELVRNVIKKITNKKYTLTFDEINLKIRKQEERWGGVIGTIVEGLYSKKEFHVKGFSYSAHPQPMTLYIKTTISSSNPDSKQLGIKIESTVKEFLESKEVREIIKDDEYQIIVYSKDKKKIN
ncbi:DUF4030 domain-containing protein [Bacillus sp. JJ722]|uniref:DUF4030 domain-containing protein n=1 Tax=Bacillus sp. JJ722 TaxID=3122973 RepID=UPI003000C296